MKESFVFYSSFYQALQELDDDKDKLALFMAISEYALTGTLPELQGVVKGFFILIKPLLDANNKRYSNGIRGGRPRKKETEPAAPEKETFPQAAEKTAETEKQAPQNTTDVTFSYEGDGKIHGVDEKLFSYWQQSFPGLDVGQELKKAEVWLDSHRSQRKRDIKKFLANWMIRNQTNQNNAPPGKNAYDKLDGNTPVYVSEEDRRAFDGF